MTRPERVGYAAVAILEAAGIIACFLAGQTALAAVWLASVVGIVAAAVGPIWGQRRRRRNMVAYWQRRMDLIRWDL